MKKILLPSSYIALIYESEYFIKVVNIVIFIVQMGKLKHRDWNT